MESEKLCKRCDLAKPLAEFYRDKSRKDGLGFYCKACFNAKQTVYIKRDPEKRRQFERGWHERNPGRKAEYSARHYRQNREKALDSRRISGLKWRTANREEILARRRAKYQENLEASRAKKREYQRKRWARAGQAVTAAQEAEIVAKTGGLCNYCPKAWEHLDHFSPLGKGGAHTVDNLVPACAACNGSKYNKDPYEWMALKGVRPKVVPHG